MINTTSIASLLSDLCDLIEGIDQDGELAPPALPDRLTLALDMMIDDACDYQVEDETYPYAFSPSELINIRDDFRDERNS